MGGLTPCRAVWAGCQYGVQVPDRLCVRWGIQAKQLAPALADHSQAVRQLGHVRSAGRAQRSPEVALDPIKLQRFQVAQGLCLFGRLRA